MSSEETGEGDEAAADDDVMEEDEGAMTGEVSLAGGFCTCINNSYALLGCTGHGSRGGGGWPPRSIVQPPPERRGGAPGRHVPASVPPQVHMSPSQVIRDYSNTQLSTLHPERSFTLLLHLRCFGTMAPLLPSQQQQGSMVFECNVCGGRRTEAEFLAELDH